MFLGVTPHVWDHSCGCLGGAAVRHRTRDRKVAGSTPGWSAIKL